MVGHIEIRNLITNDVVTMYRAEGTVILETIDWGSPSIKLSSYRVPKQIGSTKKGVTVEDREIKISGYIRADLGKIKKLGLSWKQYLEDQKEDIEKTKKKLNRFFTPYQEIEITAEGEHKIVGTPESSVKYSYSEHENNEVLCFFSVYVLCHSPMFVKSSNYVELAQMVKMFHFPLVIPEVGIEDDELHPTNGVVFGEIASNQAKLITNEGDAPVGCIIRMVAHGGTVNNPKLINVTRNEYIGFSGVTLSDTDYIEINTIKGQESVFKYVGGRPISLIGNLIEGSKFLQINVGAEYFYYDMDGSEQNLQTIINYSETVFNFEEM